MRVRPSLLMAPLLLGALLVPGHAQDDKGGWPFGGGTGFRGKDLYNLGLLGVKVRDPERPAIPG